jgi:hypothetical protein
MFSRISVSQAEFDDWLTSRYEFAYGGKYYMKYERDELPKNYWIYLSEKVTGERAKGIHHLGCLCCYADTMVHGPCEFYADCRQCSSYSKYKDPENMEIMYKMTRDFYENRGPVRIEKVRGIVDKLVIRHIKLKPVKDWQALVLKDLGSEGPS